jgi:hypothetical protein
MSNHESPEVESTSSAGTASHVGDALDQLLRLLARDVVCRLRRQQGLTAEVDEPHSIEHGPRDGKK